MTRFTRRTTLYGMATGGVVAFAGCTEGGTPGDGSDGDGDGDADGGAGDGSDGDPGGDLSTAVQQVGRALSGPAWDPGTRRGFCTLITADRGANWLFRDAPERTTAFVEATDFEESVLAYVESIGPTTCDDEVAFADVAVEDGTLLADATVENTAADDEACGEAITYPAALLRVTADPLPEALRLSITDGWGDTTEVRGDDGVLDPDRLAGYVRPGGEPRTVPVALDCDDESFQRHPTIHDGEVSWGSGGATDDHESGLELRVIDPSYAGDDPAEALTVERGDTVRIEMTNVSARVAYVGNHGKYNLEIFTEAGWTEVRGADEERFGYTDEAIGHPPGDTHAWEFELTESGLVADENQPGDLRVCPDLQPGRYRFVFWGADDLAVAFDYVG